MAFCPSFGCNFGCWVYVIVVSCWFSSSLNHCFSIWPIFLCFFVVVSVHDLSFCASSNSMFSTKKRWWCSNSLSWARNSESVCWQCNCNFEQAMCLDLSKLFVVSVVNCCYSLGCDFSMNYYMSKYNSSYVTVYYYSCRWLCYMIWLPRLIWDECLCQSSYSNTDQSIQNRASTSFIFFVLTIFCYWVMIWCLHSWRELRCCPNCGFAGAFVFLGRTCCCIMTDNLSFVMSTQPKKAAMVTHSKLKHHGSNIPILTYSLLHSYLPFVQTHYTNYFNKSSSFSSHLASLSPNFYFEQMVLIHAMRNLSSSHSTLFLLSSQICLNRGWFYSFCFYRSEAFEWMAALCSLAVAWDFSGCVSVGIYIEWILICRVRHICLVQSGSATLLNLGWSYRRPETVFRLKVCAFHLLGVPASAAPPGFWETLTIASPDSEQPSFSLTVAFANHQDGLTIFAWTWAFSFIFARMSFSPTLRLRRQRPACSVVSARGRRYHLWRFQHPENCPVGYRSQDADVFLALLLHSGNLQWSNSLFLSLGRSSGSSTSQLIAFSDGSWHFDTTPLLLLIP